MGEGRSRDWESKTEKQREKRQIPRSQKTDEQRNTENDTAEGAEQSGNDHLVCWPCQGIHVCPPQSPQRAGVHIPSYKPQVKAPARPPARLATPKSWQSWADSATCWCWGELSMFPSCPPPGDANFPSPLLPLPHFTPPKPVPASRPLYVLFPPLGILFPQISS